MRSGDHVSFPAEVVRRDEGVRAASPAWEDLGRGMLGSSLVGGIWYLILGTKQRQSTNSTDPIAC